AARHGVPLRPESLQRRDLARDLRVHRDRQPAAVRARLPEPEADEARQRVLPVPRSRKDAARAVEARAAARRGPRGLTPGLPRRGSRAYPPAMARFLVKTEPSTYSFADLQRDKKTVWDGVSNPVGCRNLATIRKGDTVIVYHTGDEKQCVGLATAAS